MTELTMNNSRTITDYAFMRHLSPSHGVTTEKQLTDARRWAPTFKYTAFEWSETAPDGHPRDIVRMLDNTGETVHLFVIDYYTRVPCEQDEHHWATHYFTTTDAGNGNTGTMALCDEHVRYMSKLYADNTAITVTVSEPLRIGQH